jgi:hypothetical protein
VNQVGEQSHQIPPHDTSLLIEEGLPEFISASRVWKPRFIAAMVKLDQLGASERETCPSHHAVLPTTTGMPV